MFNVSTLSLRLLGRGSDFWHVKNLSYDLFLLKTIPRLCATTGDRGVTTSWSSFDLMRFKVTKPRSEIASQTSGKISWWNDPIILSPMIDWQRHYMTNVMILTSQSSTFLFYVVTYHFHLLMVCISPSWFETQEHILPTRTFQNEANCLQKSWCCKVVMNLV
jgi:hypothetical protein